MEMTMNKYITDPAIARDKEIKDLSLNKHNIRLAVPPQIGVFILPLLFTEFKELHPEIDLEIVETGGIDALSMLEADELDLSLTNYDNKFSNNLTYHKLTDNEVCFCISKEMIMKHTEML